jgi:hypothetical protein
VSVKVINDMNEATVKFRYAGIQHPDGEIGAIILDCATYRSAIRTFHFIHGYLATSGAKSLTVSFVQYDTAKGQLLVTIEYGNMNARIHVAGIEWQYVQRLCASLEIFPYYLILAGYSEKGVFYLLPVGSYHFFKADIDVNGSRLYGNERLGIDWKLLLDRIRL